MTDETMHIERVEVTNFKRIKSVDISTADEAIVTIGGKNAQGKSSLLDAVWNTLGRKQTAVTMPIRDGESKAASTITLSGPDGTGLVATRTWKGERSTLTLRVKGSKANLDKPQEILDGIIGDFAFDPMAFATMPEKKRRDVLVDIVGVDVSEIDKNIAKAREERLLVGRDKKRVEGALAEAEPPAVDLPEEFVSVQDLVHEQAQRSTLTAKKDALRSEWQSVKAEIAKLEKRLTTIAQEGAVLESEIKDLRELGDINRDLANAESTNQAIHAAAEYRRIKAEFEEHDATYDSWTSVIEQLEADKAAKLAEITLPIDGLTFDDDSVYFNGVPFSQASAAERIRISVAIAVAMNPTLRVVCVKDATLMDEDQLALLKQIAAEHDVQLFLEMVGESGDYTVVLEDGAAK